MANAYGSGEDKREPTKAVRYWLNQIETAQKAREKWYERARKINERYLDEREHATEYAASSTMNVLWANVETIRPALYAKTPNARVSRRYRDKDKVGRWAAEVMERSIGYGLETYGFDYVMRSCVQDYLLPGLAQVWVSYAPQIEGDAIVWEECKIKHLHYKDFLHGPARTWDEVEWGAQRAFLTKEEAEAHPHIGPKSKELTFEEANESPDKQAVSGTDEKAEIWEIWDKPSRKVIFVSKNSPEILAEVDPFLALEGFFPFPRPLFATLTTDKLIPVPDFYLYQNQADEIDRMTQRIDLMTQALRVVGLYDGTQGSLQSLLERRTNTNEMIACDSWAVFAQQGGFKGSVEFLPLKEIIEALNACYEARDRAKQVMYEITGISDIVRGASDSKETATAQQIKTQWGGLRIRDRQSDVQRFARDIIRLKAEIMAENYQPETLRQMSNVPLLDMAAKQQLQQRQQFIQQAQQMAQQNPEQAQAIVQANPQIMQQLQPLSLDEMQSLQEPSWEEVIQLLKDQKLRAFRIDIETDSTINTDEAEEKAARTEFVTALTTVITAWGPIVLAQPKMAPLFGEVLTFAVRAFPTADSLETAIEEMVETFSQEALLGPPQAPPEDPKVGIERERVGMDREKMGLDRERMAKDDMMRQQDMDSKERMHAATEQAKVMSERQKIEGEIAKTVAQSIAMAPKPGDVQASLAPLYDAIQMQMQNLADTQLQANALQQQSLEGALEMLRNAMNMVAAYSSAPRQIEVQRDGSGQITGGMARPVLN